MLCVCVLVCGRGESDVCGCLSTPVSTHAHLCLWTLCEALHLIVHAWPTCHNIHLAQFSCLVWYKQQLFIKYNRHVVELY